MKKKTLHLENKATMEINGQEKNEICERRKEVCFKYVIYL